MCDLKFIKLKPQCGGRATLGYILSASTTFTSTTFLNSKCVIRRMGFGVFVTFLGETLGVFMWKAAKGIITKYTEI